MKTSNNSRLAPRAAANERTTVPTSSAGATSERRSSTRIANTTSRTRGTSSFVSRSTAARRSASRRSRHRRARAPRQRHEAPGEGVDGSESVLAERICLEDDLEADGGLPQFRLADPGDAGRRSRGPTAALGPSLVCHENDGGRAPRPEGLLEQPLTSHRLDGSTEEVRGRRGRRRARASPGKRAESERVPIHAARCRRSIRVRGVPRSYELRDARPRIGERTARARGGPRPGSGGSR